MRHSNLILFSFLIVCSGVVAQPAFKYKRAIMSVEREGWYTLTLPDEIFRDLNRGLTDLRLLSISGSDTVEVPYVLKVQEDEIIEQKFDLPLFNKSTLGRSLYLTFELRPSRKVNYLNLEFEEENYLGHVTVEGSDDRLQWFDIAKEERIASVKKEDNDYVLSSVRFPLSAYRYLRLRVDSDTPLRFRKASFAYDSVRPGNHHDVALTWRTKTDRESRHSTVDIEMNAYGPVNTLNLEIDSDMDFYRHFRLEYVRDSTQTQKGWVRLYQQIAEGYLTSFEPSTIRFPVVLTKHLRLVISDRDNPPLRIRKMSGVGPYVIITSHLKPGDNFLFYGGGAMREPSYDLAHFRDRIPEHTAAAVLGDAEEIVIDEDDTRPLFENPVWLWSIMGVMIVGLGFFTIRMMRK